MAANDFIRNELSFDEKAFMNEFLTGLNLALDILSGIVQSFMKQEIMTNGNGSRVMRETASNQVKELSRKIDGYNIELEIGIDPSTLGGFNDQVYVRTMVVLHGNVAHGPLMTKPGEMTWVKDVDHMHLSPQMNEDGTQRQPMIMPQGMMQYEKWKGFGADRRMYDNIFNNQINMALRLFDRMLTSYVQTIDFSKFVIVR